MFSQLYGVLKFHHFISPLGAMGAGDRDWEPGSEDVGKSKGGGKREDGKRDSQGGSNKKK